VKGRGSRFIHSQSTETRQIPDLLQAIFVAELAEPSNCLWIVSPWISDIPLIDNRANAFLTLEPSWPRGKIRLSQVLSVLVDRGATVRVITRPSIPSNQSFLQRVQGLVHITETSDLHEKGVLGSQFYLSGSMNFTYLGITLNEEVLHYETNDEVIAEHTIIFTQRWGGAKP
jgi:hypothetical protein